MLTIDTNETKRHLHEIRLQRQRQIRTLLQQCEQLRMKHKEIFENQWKSRPMVQRTFDKKIDFYDDEVPIEHEISQLFSESPSSSIFFGIPILNDRFVTPKKKTGQRCSSVSSVATIEKQTNRVYDKWPDDDRLSQIVGHRIQRKTSTIDAASSMDNVPKRRKKSLKSATTLKQVKNLSNIEKDAIKKKSLLPLPSSTSMIILKSNEIQPTLPTLLCPSSKIYSKRIQTRQWLVENSFLCRSLPLI